MFKEDMSMSVNATGLASAQAEVYASYKTDTSAKT